MKTNMTISQHPNQESKTGEAPYGSFTKKNFSDNESLPGRATMHVGRMKGSSIISIYTLLTQFFRKLFR